MNQQQFAQLVWQMRQYQMLEQRQRLKQGQALVEVLRKLQELEEQVDAEIPRQRTQMLLF